MSDTARPKDESKRQREERRRSSALRDFRDAVLQRFIVLGDSLGWIRSDTNRIKQRIHRVISSQTSMEANQQLLLEGQQKLTAMVQDLLDEKQRSSEEPEEQHVGHQAGE